MNEKPKLVYILGIIAVILFTLLFVKLVDGGYIRFSHQIDSGELSNQPIESVRTEDNDLNREAHDAPDQSPLQPSQDQIENVQSEYLSKKESDTITVSSTPTTPPRKELVERVPHNAHKTAFSKSNPITIGNFSAHLDQEPIDDIVLAGTSITLDWNVQPAGVLCAIIGDQYLFGFQLVEPVGTQTFLIDANVPFSGRAYLSPTLRCAGAYEEVLSPEAIVYRVQESIDTRTILPDPTVCDPNEPGIYLTREKQEPLTLSGGESFTIDWKTCGVNDVTPVYFTLVNKDLKQVDLTSFTDFTTSEYYNRGVAELTIPPTTPPGIYNLKVGALHKAFSVFDELYDFVEIDQLGFALSRCVEGQFLDIVFDAYSSPLVVTNDIERYELGQFTVTAHCNITVENLEVVVLTNTASDISIALYENEINVSGHTLYNTTTSQPLVFEAGVPRTFAVRGIVRELNQYSIAIQRINGFSSRDPYFTDLAGLARPRSQVRDVEIQNADL